MINHLEIDCITAHQYASRIILPVLASIIMIIIPLCEVYHFLSSCEVSATQFTINPQMIARTGKRTQPVRPPHPDHRPLTARQTLVVIDFSNAEPDDPEASLKDFFLNTLSFYRGTKDVAVIFQRDRSAYSSFAVTRVCTRNTNCHRVYVHTAIFKILEITFAHALPLRHVCEYVFYPRAGKRRYAFNPYG